MMTVKTDAKKENVWVFDESKLIGTLTKNKSEVYPGQVGHVDPAIVGDEPKWKIFKHRLKQFFNYEIAINYKPLWAEEKHCLNCEDKDTLYSCYPCNECLVWEDDDPDKDIIEWRNWKAK
jgi:hypothetical protein